MKELDEETALAILFANTRRKKRSEDLLTIAKSCDYLVRLYGSRKPVAERVGLSTEMIREFLLPLKLPKEIQKLTSERKIDSWDIVKEISTIKGTQRQLAVAYAFVNSLSKDVRDIKRLIKEANLPIGEAKKTILNAKPKGLHIFVMDFEDEIYRAIIEQSKALKIKPAELVREIVTNWLERKGKKEK